MRRAASTLAFAARTVTTSIRGMIAGIWPRRPTIEARRRRWRRRLAWLMSRRRSVGVSIEIIGQGLLWLEGGTEGRREDGRDGSYVIIYQCMGGTFFPLTSILPLLPSFPPSLPPTTQNLILPLLSSFPSLLTPTTQSREIHARPHQALRQRLRRLRPLIPSSATRQSQYHHHHHHHQPSKQSQIYHVLRTVRRGPQPGCCPHALLQMCVCRNERWSEIDRCLCFAQCSYTSRCAFEKVFGSAGEPGAGCGVSVFCAGADGGGEGGGGCAGAGSERRRRRRRGGRGGGRGRRRRGEGEREEGEEKRRGGEREIETLREILGSFHGLVVSFRRHIPQHPATHCNALQHAATRRNTLQHAATHCNTMQHTTRHCNTLQHPATPCNTLQHLATPCNAYETVLKAAKLVSAPVCCSVLQCAAVCCSVLQCVAVCCSVLQCVAVCCSVLQCDAVCCSVQRNVFNLV